MASFPEGVIAAAQEAQRKWGVPASVTLAQWAQESGFGQHMPEGSDNPFGIKAVGNQPYVLARTHECIRGRYVTVNARFRKFASLAEAFDAHAELIARAHVYAPAMACKGDPEAFAHELTHRYATDPHYGAELVAIMRSHDLRKYDVA